jgi:hypothetical protein
MTTYGNNVLNPYLCYVRADYRHTYALIDFETGEVRSIACDLQSAPLKTLYGYLDGLRRECEHKGAMCHLLLVNCRTGKAVEEIRRDYGREQLIAALYEGMEGGEV